MPFAGAACSGKARDRMPERTLKQVLESHAPRLMALPGVVGTGEGLCAGMPCIKVFVTGRTPALVRDVGGDIDGYPVEIVETGAFRSRDTD